MRSSPRRDDRRRPSAALLEEMERAARDGDLAGARDKLEHVRGEAQAALDYLRTATKGGADANAIPVLVVDDDPVSSAQLGALAKAAGYEVRSAPNGREAWSCCNWRACPS